MLSIPSCCVLLHQLGQRDTTCCTRHTQHDKCVPLVYNMAYVDGFWPLALTCCAWHVIVMTPSPHHPQERKEAIAKLMEEQNLRAAAESALHRATADKYGYTLCTTQVHAQCTTCTHVQLLLVRLMIALYLHHTQGRTGKEPCTGNPGKAAGARSSTGGTCPVHPAAGKPPRNTGTTTRA